MAKGNQVARNTLPVQWGESIPRARRRRPVARAAWNAASVRMSGAWYSRYALTPTTTATRRPKRKSTIAALSRSPRDDRASPAVSAAFPPPSAAAPAAFPNGSGGAPTTAWNAPPAPLPPERPPPKTTSPGPADLDPSGRSRMSATSRIERPDFPVSRDGARETYSSHSLTRRKKERYENATAAG